jgi:FKBP-type peptidyl-prolyl cis-trans isomerase FklB
MMTEEEMRTVMNAFRQEMASKQMEKMKTVGDKNKKEGEAFLVENKKKKGVKTLPSGLQYKVIKEGTGKMPKTTDKVSCQYEGTLIDGTVFDSSYKRGEPATFPVNGVIPGWTEALQMMKVGSKWQLFIPSKLGYGERGAGPQIGPNAVLIFTVELISVL